MANNERDEDSRNFAVDAKMVQNISPALDALLKRTVALRDTLPGRGDHAAALDAYRTLAQSPVDTRLKTVFVRAVAENWHMIDDLRRGLSGQAEKLTDDPVSCLPLLFTLRGRQTMTEAIQRLTFDVPEIG